MKLILGGSDLEKLERVRTQLLGMGVGCEIVYSLDEEREELPSYPELWVRQDEDFDAAMVAMKYGGSVEAASEA